MTKRACSWCEREVRVTQDGQLSAHRGRDKQPCRGGRAVAHESKDEKAQRYVEEGRVGDPYRVEQWGSNEVAVCAEVRGSDGTVYIVKILGEVASCTCPATRTCVHIRALRLVGGRV